MRRPSVTVGFPWFVLPFDSTKANFGGGFADVLEVLARRFRGEVGASGTWVGVEPFCHFSLVFFSGMLVAEYVGDLAFFAVVWAWDGPEAVLRGPPGIRKEFQKSLCLSETVLGDRARCAPSKVGALGDR